MAQKNVTQSAPLPKSEVSFTLTKREFDALRALSFALDGLTSLLSKQDADGATDAGYVLAPINDQFFKILGEIEGRQEGGAE